MILFKKTHIPSILSGEKTQTRRLGRKRWNVGAIHRCKTGYGGPPFALVRILKVWRERLRDISYADARAEGYATPADYVDAFCRINKIANPFDALDIEVWCVEFERVTDA